MLNANCALGWFSCINTGISGSNSTELINLYRDNWLKQNPNYVIIILSHNDRDGEVLRINVKKFIRLNQESGIETILVLEANDHNRSGLLQNHQILRELALENKILVLDVHQRVLRDRRERAGTDCIGPGRCMPGFGAGRVGVVDCGQERARCWTI